MKEILSDGGNHLNKPVGLGLNSEYAAGTKGIWYKNKMAMNTPSTGRRNMDG